MPRILVATDGSGFAIAAARRALSLLTPHSQVTVVTVVPLIPVAGVAASGLGAAPMVDPRRLEDAQAAWLSSARADLDATVAALGIDADARIEHGDAGTVICEVARSGDFDVIVIGSHGSGFLKRALLGSVSNDVLHHAPCPVVVVRDVQ